MKTCFIFVYRESNTNRKNNLEKVLINMPSEYEIIVVEQDIKQHFLSSIFVYNAGLFNRGWGFNVGALKTNADVLVFSDCDLLIQKEDINKCLDKIKEVDVVDPKGFIIDLAENETVENNTKRYRTSFDLAGGIVFFKREAFFKINGWDEDLRGWGVEDNVMTIKIKKLLTFCKINCVLHHLFHSDRVKNARNQDFYRKNYSIFKKIKSLTYDQLTEYYKDKQIGNIEKYVNE